MLDPSDRQALIAVARDAIEAALRAGVTVAPAPDPEAHPPALRRPGATFVTLRNADGSLRGCVGTIEAREPLVEDAARNACSAAFRDPRFTPLSAEEWPQVVLSLSVLTPPRALTFGDEADLLAQLRPGVDGLVIAQGGSRATFLPQVWDSLPEPPAFVGQLKVKMGRSIDWWADDVQAWVYQVEKLN